jgi:hypothetical protein
LKKFIRSESDARVEFNKNVHTFLPSSFLPQLRDSAPEILLEGPNNELDFPRIEDNSIVLKDMPQRAIGGVSHFEGSTDEVRNL